MKVQPVTVKRYKRPERQYPTDTSTDKIFNQNGNFSSSLMEAVAQVRDFQAWVSDNLSYAQKKLPEIKHPEGLVVLGRRDGFHKL